MVARCEECGRVCADGQHRCPAHKGVAVVPVGALGAAKQKLTEELTEK